jgi:GTPase SAR1 family protein
MNLSRWLADARALASPNLVAVLVGNKADREDEREVEWSEASRWAAENGTFMRLSPPFYMVNVFDRGYIRRPLFGGFITYRG